VDVWPQDLTASIVVYDNPTHRSSMALTMLRLMGYENVRVLGGGTGAWANAELPLVK
jgi:rhodanese-related sulfurtransferase